MSNEPRNPFTRWLRERKARRVYFGWMEDWFRDYAIGENVFGYEKHRNAAISSARRASGLPTWEPPVH